MARAPISAATEVDRAIRLCHAFQDHLVARDMLVRRSYGPALRHMLASSFRNRYFLDYKYLWNTLKSFTSSITG